MEKRLCRFQYGLLCFLFETRCAVILPFTNAGVDDLPSGAYFVRIAFVGSPAGVGQGKIIVTAEALQVFLEEGTFPTD